MVVDRFNLYKPGRCFRKGFSGGFNETNIQKASHTCAWLGEGSEDSDTAFMFLEWLDSQDIISRRGYTIEPWIKDLREVDGFHQKEWLAVNNLLRRPWWTRMWTLQEYVIPKRLQIHCGHQSISRDKLRQALNCNYDCGVDLGTLTPYNRGRLKFKDVPVWQDIEHWQDIESYTELSLVATLAYLSDHQASDPRDYVYAILGVVNDPDLAGTPDYNQPVEVLYTKILQAFIERYQSLDVICFATIFQDLTSAHTSLASWVPDWRIRAFPLVVPLMVSQTEAMTRIGNFGPWRPVYTIYNATQGLKPCVEFESGSREFRCLGSLIGTIDGLAAYPSVDQGHWASPKYELVQPSSRLFSPESTPLNLAFSFVEDVMLAIMRCLVLDREDHRLGKLAPLRFFLEFNDLLATATTNDFEKYAEFHAWFAANQNLRLKGWTLEKLVTCWLDVG